MLSADSVEKIDSLPPSCVFEVTVEAGVTGNVAKDLEKSKSPFVGNRGQSMDAYEGRITRTQPKEDDASANSNETLQQDQNKMACENIQENEIVFGYGDIDSINANLSQGDEVSRLSVCRSLPLAPVESAHHTFCLIG